MTRQSGGGTRDQGGAPKSAREERGPGSAGNDAPKGNEHSPGTAEAEETAADECAAPIDLDTAHDRAS